jgi:hypothetical protein
MYLQKNFSALKGHSPYADLYAMLRNLDTLTWLTPYAAVVRKDERVDCWVHQLAGPRSFCFSADGKDIYALALARSHEALLEICDVVVRLLAASVVQSVVINNWRYLDGWQIY